MKRSKRYAVSVERVGSEKERAEAYRKALRYIISKCYGEVMRNEKGGNIHKGVDGRTG